MPIVLVANAKGGSGKSTLATNIAGYFATVSPTVMLGDTDQQQSSRGWLQRRPASCRPISTWEIDDQYIARPPQGTSHVVLDSAAGVKGWRLKELLRMADHVLVPIQPSLFDILASQDFLQQLLDGIPASERQKKIAIVGMRVNGRTRAAEQLELFLSGLKLPALTFLRDTQNYIQLAAHGLTLFDVPPARVQRDREQWQPIVNWLNV